MNDRIQRTVAFPGGRGGPRPSSLSAIVSQHSTLNTFPPRSGKKGIRAANSSAFTLIEVLCVLMILAILIGVIVSVVGLVQRATQCQRATTDANALVQAVLHYQQVYGSWPADPGTRNSTNLFFVAGFSNQVNVFAYANLPQADVDQSAVITALTNNPRCIPFLTVPANALNSSGQLIDPWRHPYLLVMDARQTTFHLDNLAFSNLPAFAISAGYNPPVLKWIFSAGGSQ